MHQDQLSSWRLMLTLGSGVQPEYRLRASAMDGVNGEGHTFSLLPHYLLNTALFVSI